MKSKLYLFFALSFLMGKGTFAQSSDSLQLLEKPKFEPKKLYVPLGLMTVGLASEGKIKQEVYDWRQEQMPNFRNKFDDYLHFVPHAAVYGFEWLGMQPKTDWKNRAAIHIKGELMTLGAVYILKKVIDNKRPDGTVMSFPSGHAANAFAGATILSIEYQKNHPWVPYVAYGVATGVGVMRVANNRHYISDVLFGAGLGILSMKLAYWTHQYKWNKPKSTQDPFAGILYKLKERK